LNQQESYLLNSFAIADCLIELEEDKEFFKQGEMVRVLMII
jgi:molybdopterin biosynthesis enzyme